ncbi:hypothetical protein F5Y14DRAFT_451055 [Nemania sp. NC0429]|nr:hypothetical protein F5Y14DRAFT_451055 [Nemania sp. NC0429]
MSRSDNNGAPGVGLPAFDFQIAPESGSFLSSQTKYRVTFRHVNCADYDGQKAPHSAIGTPRPRGDDHLSINIDLQTGSPDNRHPSAGGMWIEVCPGGCNEKKGTGKNDFDVGANDDKASTDAIAAQIYAEARSICSTAHPWGADVLEVFDSRIVWARGHPRPGYLSPSQMKIVEHSSEVTSGHLALIQARGNIDKLGVGYRSYDYQGDKTKGGVSQRSQPGNKGRIEPGRSTHDHSFRFSGQTNGRSRPGNTDTVEPGRRTHDHHHGHRMGRQA